MSVLREIVVGIIGLTRERGTVPKRLRASPKAKKSRPKPAGEKGMIIIKIIFILIGALAICGGIAYLSHSIENIKRQGVGFSIVILFLCALLFVCIGVGSIVFGLWC